MCVWLHSHYCFLYRCTRLRCWEYGTHFNTLPIKSSVILWYNLAYPSGVLCAFVESFCSPNPCGSNGRCVENNSGFKCVCDVSHTGRLCRTGQSACWYFANFLQRCFRRMRCNMYTVLHVLSIMTSLSELLCISINPCWNGGSCVENGSDQPSCDCPDTFTGPTCEIGNDVAFELKIQTTS